MKTNIYIDGANLHKGAQELGVSIDYKKLHGWLRQKYSAANIYLFLELVSKYSKLYQRLRGFGYSLIFKEALVTARGDIKGNCDAEIVLMSVSHFYENECSRHVFITGDGDFRCLVDFLIDKNQKVIILAPNPKKCSILLKRSGAKLTTLDDHYPKFKKK